MTLPKDDIEATRTRILDAAAERFRQFGFGKTTMAEIAGDCGMSAANLYRYFENKHDIGAAMACQCLGDKVNVLQAVLQNPSLSAGEKIEAYIVDNLRYTHAQWAERPRMNELVDVICQTRQDLVEDYVCKARGILGKIVEEGVAAGEFEPCDVEEVSGALKSATFMFDYPSAMNACPWPLVEFEARARAVARLVLNGLKKS